MPHGEYYNSQGIGIQTAPWIKLALNGKAIFCLVFIVFMGDSLRIGLFVIGSIPGNRSFVQNVLWVKRERRLVSFSQAVIEIMKLDRSIDHIAFWIYINRFEANQFRTENVFSDAALGVWEIICGVFSLPPDRPNLADLTFNHQRYWLHEIRALTGIKFTQFTDAIYWL